eukprot:5662269-Ditylum_brightwellii.AAC.1
MFTNKDKKERNCLYQKMSSYWQVVSYMFMLQTEMPPCMPIDAVALGTWKFYMGQLAIKIKK